MAQKKISMKKASVRNEAKTSSTKAGGSTTGSTARRAVKKAVKKTAARPAGASAKKAGARGAAAGRKKAASSGGPSAPAAKKAPVKKTAAKKISPAKKVAAARPAVTKKAETIKAMPKKTAAKKAVQAKTAAATRKPKASAAAARAKKPVAGKAAKSRRLSAREMDFYRRLLLDLRDRVVDGINFLAGENLNNNTREQSGDLSNYGMHMADHGTDSFDRELALSMVSNEQELIYEIDEALERMNSGTYGICETTGEPIERERLKIIPYARFSVKAQEEMERGRNRFRPFGASFMRNGSDVT